VIDGDPGAPGQELVGEPVNVAFGLAGAGLSEQAGDFPEWDAADIEQRREGVSEIMEPQLVRNAVYSAHCRLPDPVAEVREVERRAGRRGEQ
jgi:hypothetical protein